jgi:hypothetical protein
MAGAATGAGAAAGAAAAATGGGGNGGILFDCDGTADADHAQYGDGDSGTFESRVDITVLLCNEDFRCIQYEAKNLGPT